jgi:hypothetical protein
LYDGNGAVLTKELIRQRHRDQRLEKIRGSKEVISRWSDLARYFANGDGVEPARIRPRLELISARTWQSQLFALSSLYWSIPTSRGYGRRLRFLCWDDNTDCLLGIIALGDPVFNLAVRDRYIGWSGADRLERLWSVMDAFVLGALPPYSGLLCGKMLACFLRSTDIGNMFSKKYRNYRSIISGKKRKNAELALVTTSSALGRSSVYNRLHLGGERYLTSVGETRGFGHFHIPNALFVDMRYYLEIIGHEYANGHYYGMGPNWRLRVVREAITRIGLSPMITQHGIAREVFICETAPNAREYLRGDDTELAYNGRLSVDEIAQLALDRWVVPRSRRDETFRSWQRDSFLKQITTP